MITTLLTALVFFAAGICVEGYFILGNQQRTRTTNEQILASSIENRRLLETNMRLLGLHPSKSADPTTAPDDAPAYVPYAGLRELDADRWADDGGPEPARGPDTRPAAAVLIDHAFDEAETGPIPVVLDDVDRLLMERFNLTEGRQS